MCGCLFAIESLNIKPEYSDIVYIEVLYYIIMVHDVVMMMLIVCMCLPPLMHASLGQELA